MLTQHLILLSNPVSPEVTCYVYYYLGTKIRKKVKKDEKRFDFYMFRDIDLTGFPGSASGKKLPANAGDGRHTGWIPGLGRSSGEGRDNSLPYSCLENSKDRGD